MAATAAGIGVFLLVWAVFRGGFFTIVLAAVGVALLGPGLLDQLATGAVRVTTSILNSIGGVL